MRPVGGLLGEQLEDDGLDLGRDGVGEGGHLLVDVREGDIDLGGSAEGAPPHQGLVGDDAQPVEVAGRGGHVPHGLLGGEVLGGAHHHAGGRQRALVDAGGDAEVGELGQALAVDEDVGGLDVPVDDAGVVDDLEGAGHLRQDRQDLRG